MNEHLRLAAEAAPGFMPAEEGFALYAAAYDAARHGPVLEIGSYCGKSTVYLAAAAREYGQLVISVDHHRGSEEHQPGWEYHDPALVDPHTNRIDTLPTFRRVLYDAGVEDTVVAIVARSRTVAAIWSTPLGMVFVDGGHTVSAATEDYNGWSPHIVVDGLLAIHDVFPDPADGGQAPYGIYRDALSSGAFVEVSATGSLRVLRRMTGPAHATSPWSAR